MDHPHITRLLDVYETKENFHLVMEYMEGGDLHEFVIDNGRFSEQEARKAIHQMLLALDYIHRQGVVHRDVKLENFLRDSKGSLQLTDFGFSRSCGASGKEEWTDGCGSVGYIAPEVVKCIRGQKKWLFDPVRHVECWGDRLHLAFRRDAIHRRRSCRHEQN
jgi:serine/threonine protein kinase